MRTSWGQDEVQGTLVMEAGQPRDKDDRRPEGTGQDRSMFPSQAHRLSATFQKLQKKVLPVSKDPQKATRKPSESTFG